MKQSTELAVLALATVLAVLALATVGAVKTVASAKTANLCTGIQQYFRRLKCNEFCNLVI